MLMKKFTRKSRTERKKEILAAATNVFLQKGYRNTTMEDIIKETTLSKGGFYHYFKSTREIFLAIMEECAQENVYCLKALESSCQNKDEFINKLGEYLLQRLFDKSDERNIYLMGVSELFYDPEYLEYLDKIEQKHVKDLGRHWLQRFPDCTEEQITERLKLLSEVFHALVISCHLFKKEELHRKNQKYIKNIFLNILPGT